MGLLSAPSLSVSLSESPQYRTLGVGLTDRIFLLGHTDGIPVGEVYPVQSMRDALKVLNVDNNEPATPDERRPFIPPVVMALLEAYLAGARDLWVMSVAPMSEYEPDIDLRDASYYAQYKSRLSAAYETLKEWDIAQITIPVEAPFNSTVDFLGPLVNYCVEAFNISGEIHLGLMGTRGEIEDHDVQALINDGRLGALGEAGKFVSVFVGDGTFNLPQMPISHTSSVVPSVAAMLSQSPLDRGVTYRTLRHVVDVVGSDLTKEQINSLAEAGLNPVGRNIKGRRGMSFQVVPFTDNTLAKTGSDYWSLTQMRLVSVISRELRAMGKRSLGTIGYGMFKDDVRTYLINLVKEGGIREYSVNFQRNPNDKTQVFVDLVVKPYFGVRDVQVGITVGPGA